MSKRHVKLLLLAPLVLFALAWAALAWLWTSGAGSNWVVSQLTDRLPGELVIKSMEGTLSDGLRLEGLDYSDGGMTVRISRLELGVDYSLTPLFIRLGPAKVEGLEVRLPDSAGGPDIDLADVLSGLRLPVLLHVHEVEIAGLGVYGHDGDAIAELNRLTLEGRWHDSIEDLVVGVAGVGVQATLTGDLSLANLLMHDLVVEGRVHDADAAIGVEELWFKTSMEGNRDESRFTLEAGPQSGFRATGVVRDPLSEPQFDLAFELDNWPFVAMDEQDMHFSGLHGTLEGSTEDYRIQLAGALDHALLGPARFNLAGRGSAAGLYISELGAKSDFAAVTAAGSLVWEQPGPMVEMGVQLVRLDPRHWLEGWPDGFPLAGEFQVRWSKTALSVPHFLLQAAGTRFEAQGSVSADLQDRRIEGGIAWEQFAWPPGDAMAQVSSPRGELQVSGRLDDWLASGQAELATPEFPGGKFTLSGRGGKEYADLQIEQGLALGGELAGRVALDWRGPLSWQSDLVLRGITLGELWPDWPAVVTGDLRVTHDGGTGLLTLDVRNVEGEFRGEPFTAGGGLTYQDAVVRFDRAWLHSDRSILALNGALDGPVGLAYEIDVRRPGWMAELLGGNIVGSGRYAPLADNPLGGTKLTGSNLAWAGIEVQRLTVSETGGPGGELALTLNATGMRMGDGMTVDQAELQAAGDRDRQTLELTLRAGGRTLRAELEGMLADWADIPGAGWRGELRELELGESPQYLMVLKSPVAMQLATGQAEFGHGCMALDTDGEICLEGAYNEVEGVRFSGNLAAVPVSLSRIFVEHEFVFTQKLDGDFNWQRNPGDKPSGRADIRISPGELGATGDEDARVQTAQGLVGFELRDGDLTAGRFELPFPGIGEFDLAFRVSDLALDGTGRINGRARVNFSDLSFLDGLVTSLDGIHGALNSDLSISGVTAGPTFSGDVNVTGAGFRLPYLETEVHDINLQGMVNRADRFRVRGEFQAGQGTGTIDMDAVFRDSLGPQVNLTVSGQALSVANLPDLKMSVNTEMNLARKQEHWEIEGFVEVPYARATPITSFVAKVSETPDLEVVRGELPAGPNSAITLDLALYGGIDVRLGDDVRLETDIARVDMTGEVRLQWNGSSMPTGQGAVGLTGEVTAWGPLLHLTNSHVRFPGVPLDAPQLDIRAERTIYGNTLVRNSGVRVTGNPRMPEIEAYTVPPTTPDRAWGVLVSGSDVDIGQGTGALSVGTYIAPKLYLSYGFSLFNEENVVGIRYDLKRGWGVKATSSQRESGLDMSYTIEH